MLNCDENLLQPEFVIYCVVFVLSALHVAGKTQRDRFQTEFDILRI